MRQCDVNDILGVDGDWVPLDQLAIPVAQFAQIDLREGLRPPTHIRIGSLHRGCRTPSASSWGSLGCRTLAGSACGGLLRGNPSARGTDHINEQWPSYWLSRFERHGFVLVNCLRPRL